MESTNMEPVKISADNVCKTPKDLFAAPNVDQCGLTVGTTSNQTAEKLIAAFNKQLKDDGLLQGGPNNVSLDILELRRIYEGDIKGMDQERLSFVRLSLVRFFDFLIKNIIVTTSERDTFLETERLNRRPQGEQLFLLM